MTQKPQSRTLNEKRCSACKKTKPLVEFSTRRASPDGLSYKCKECEREFTRQNYIKRMSQPGAKNYYQLHKTEQLEKAKQYYRDNKEHLLAQSEVYRRNHPEVARKAGKKRRDKLKKRKLEKYSRYEIMERDSIDINGERMVICQICKKPICSLKTGRGEEELQIDHIKPVGKGGEDSKANVRCVHKTCNAERPKDGRDEKRKRKEKTSEKV